MGISRQHHLINIIGAAERIRIDDPIADSTCKACGIGRIVERALEILSGIDITRGNGEGVGTQIGTTDTPRRGDVVESR